MDASLLVHRSSRTRQGTV